MKLPKHLQEMDAGHLAGLMSGFNRFRFGFADVGEVMVSPHNGNRLVFVGNFSKKKDAASAAETTGGLVNPYLYGKLATGWAVFTVEKEVAV